MLLLRDFMAKQAWLVLWLSKPAFFSSVQFISVTQSCPTHCDSMDCSIPGIPVLHQLPDLA